MHHREYYNQITKIYDMELRACKRKFKTHVEAEKKIGKIAKKVVRSWAF